MGLALPGEYPDWYDEGKILGALPSLTLTPHAPMGALCLTRDALVEYEGWQSRLGTPDSMRFAWEPRTAELAEELFPDDEMPRRWAAFCMDSIMRNTFEDNETGRLPRVPDAIQEDQVEDWVVGRAVHYALTVDRAVSEMCEEVVNG